VLGFRLPLSSE